MNNTLIDNLQYDDLLVFNSWRHNTDYYRLNTMIKQLLLLDLDRLNKLEDSITLKNIFNHFNTIELDEKKNNIDSENIILYEMIKNNVAKTIIQLFLKNKFNSKFPRDLFSDDFLDYLQDTNLLFEKIDSSEECIFEQLMNNIYNVEYFRLKYQKKNESKFEEYIKKVKKNLKEQIYNNIIPDISIIKKLQAVIYIVNESIENTSNVDQHPSKKIIDLTKTLYISLYNSLYETIYINNESLKVYEYISTKKNIDVIKPIITQITSQITEFETYINDLKRYENFLIETLRNSIDLTNYYNESQSSYEKDTLLTTLIYSVDDTYGLLYTGCLDNYLNKAKLCILELFNSDQINVHLKTKIVLTCGNNCGKKFFFKNIDSLITFFINLEKFNTENGFNERKKVRSIICDMINNYIDYYKEKGFLNILSNFSVYKKESFITLYFSHLSDIFLEISKNKLLLSNGKSNTNKIFLVKNILYMYKSINLLCCLVNNFSYKTFYYKFVELFHTIIKNSFDSRLYSELQIFKLSKISNDLLTEKTSSVLEKIYSIFFTNLVKVSNNKNFIEYLSSGYYNKKLIENTKLIFGTFVYNSEDSANKVDELLDSINMKIDNYTSDIEKNNIKIPVRFIDSISCNLIENPIEIPDVNIILDEFTIYNHLTFNNTNPFTNNSLTKQELADHNSLGQVQDRLQFFKEDLLSWKNMYNIL